MNLLPRAWERGRTMETYTFNDRQVQRLIAYTLFTGVIAGLVIGFALSVASAC